MGRGCVASRGLLTGVVILVGPAAPPVVGQEHAVSSPPAISSSVPRTPWGVPDLQGIWTGATLTPLERPNALAGKEFLSEEEVARMEADAAQGRDRWEYQAEWWDSSPKVVPSRRTSLIVEPRNGRIPYTADARKAERVYGEGPYDSHLDLDTGERCLGDGLPMVWQGYNPNHQIFQTPDHVVIVHEMFRERRIIPLRKAAHGRIAQWNGDVRGWWEGDTLVVESAHFVDRPGYRWAATWRAPTGTLRMVERFTRVDADTIDYRATIADPARFTTAWTIENPLSRQEARGVTEGQLFEYACHEGNYALRNILTGAEAAGR
jgi:hypothetical protein